MLHVFFICVYIFKIIIKGSNIWFVKMVPAMFMSGIISQMCNTFIYTIWNNHSLAYKEIAFIITLLPQIHPNLQDMHMKHLH